MLQHEFKLPAAASSGARAPRSRPRINRASARVEIDVKINFRAARPSYARLCAPTVAEARRARPGGGRRPRRACSRMLHRRRARPQLDQHILHHRRGLHEPLSAHPPLVDSCPAAPARRSNRHVCTPHCHVCTPRPASQTSARPRRRRAHAHEASRCTLAHDQSGRDHAINQGLFPPRMRVSACRDEPYGISPGCALRRAPQARPWPRAGCPRPA